MIDYSRSMGRAAAVAGAALLCVCAAPRAMAEDAGDQAKTPMTIVLPEASATGFKPLYPERPDGVQVSMLWGDLKTGPSAGLYRFPNSKVGRFHRHPVGYHLYLVEGTMMQWNEGQSESDSVKLTPGSYRYQPGPAIHADKCISEHCLAFIKIDGPFATELVGAPPAPAAAAK